MKILSIILCLIISSSALAAPKVANLKSGQRAPFAGVLLDPEAMATIQTSKDAAAERWALERRVLEEKCELGKKFESDHCSLQKEIISKQFQVQLQEKELEIRILNEKLSKLKPTNSGLWIGIGAGIGILVGASVALVVERNF